MNNRRNYLTVDKEREDIPNKRPNWRATANPIRRAIYIAYGSNMNHEQMRRRCPGAVFLCRSRLPGWKLVFRGVADVVPDAKHSCPVALWSITPECERALDVYEGYPHHYTKVQVPIRGNRKRYQGMMYAMTWRGYSSAPSTKYFEGILDGYLQCGFSEDDQEYLFEREAVASAYEQKRLIGDPTLRRKPNGKYELFAPALPVHSATAKGFELFARSESKEFDLFTAEREAAEREAIESIRKRMYGEEKEWWME